MTLPATVHRLHVVLSDVDRAVYETLDLRLARHPSETMRHLLARALAYCLCYEEGIAFTRGLAEPDEPALWVRDLTGEITAWIDVGAPSAERLHRAAKAVPRVVVVTSHDLDLLRREARSRTVHRLEAIEVYALDGRFLDAVAEVTGRKASWELVTTGGRLYLTAGGQTLEGPLTRTSLVGDADA